MRVPCHDRTRGQSHSLVVRLGRGQALSHTPVRLHPDLTGAGPLLELDDPGSQFCDDVTVWQDLKGDVTQQRARGVFCGPLRSPVAQHRLQKVGMGAMTGQAQVSPRTRSRFPR